MEQRPQCNYTSLFTDRSKCCGRQLFPDSTTQERQTVCWRAFMRVRWWRERPGRKEGKLSHPFFKLSHERNACSNIQWMWTGGCLQTAKTSLSGAEKGGRRKWSWNKTIGELSPFCVIFVIWRCGERNEPCLASVCYHGAAAATAQTPPCCWWGATQWDCCWQTLSAWWQHGEMERAELAKLLDLTHHHVR